MKSQQKLYGRMKNKGFSSYYGFSFIENPGKLGQGTNFPKGKGVSSVISPRNHLGWAPVNWAQLKGKKRRLSLIFGLSFGPNIGNYSFFSTKSFVERGEFPSI